MRNHGSTGATEFNTNNNSTPIDFKGVSVRVDSVHVEGLGRTKDDYVESHLKDLFKVSTFEELMVVSAEVRQRLEKLECFRDIGVLIDTAKGNEATPNGYDVTFRVTEFRRFVGAVNTMVGANDGSLTFALKLPNVAGRGERVTVDHTIGSVYNKTSTFSVMKPVPGFLNTTLLGSLFHQKIPNTLSGYVHRATGGLLDFSFESARQVRHSVQYEGCWRHIEASSRNTSFPVRAQSGHSFKSALRHILTLDHRDDPVFPSRGILLKLVQEFAGVGGDAAFVKHDSELQLNIPLPVFELALQGSVRFGVLRPLDNSILSHNIHDMFFLGGPAGPGTLRGFSMRSIGSKSGGNFLGGRAYWSSALHLFCPLPFGLGRGGWGDYFRAHGFVNFGNITGDKFTPDGFGETCRTLMENFRGAYGVGLALRLGHLARIELNYCFPLRFYKGDNVVHGIQLGIGVDFL